MISVFDIYKGIPIGTIIKRDLKKEGSPKLPYLDPLAYHIKH